MYRIIKVRTGEQNQSGQRHICVFLGRNIDNHSLRSKIIIKLQEQTQNMSRNKLSDDESTIMYRNSTTVSSKD